MVGHAGYSIIDLTLLDLWIPVYHDVQERADGGTQEECSDGGQPQGWGLQDLKHDWLPGKRQRYCLGARKGDPLERAVLKVLFCSLWLDFGGKHVSYPITKHGSSQ